MSFSYEQRVRMLAQLTMDYVSYVYTHSDIILFSYENNTQFEVYRSSGSLLWSGTLNAGQNRVLTPGAGVFLVAASKPFALNVGDALTSYVWGYYAMDQYGKGLSTLFHTYQANWYGYTSFDPRVLIFAYENNTQVQVRHSASGQVIWSGSLNDGEHYSNSSLSNAFITVSANKPVAVLSYTDQGYYVPASNGTFAGTKFHTYVGNAARPNEYWVEDLNLIAYENSSVNVRNTTTGALIWSGLLNAGQVRSIPNLNGTFVTVTSSGKIAVSVSPFASYASGNYFHSLYAQDSTGTGIGTQFFVPSVASTSQVLCRLNTFAYADNTSVAIRNSQGGVVWSGILDQAESSTILSQSTVYAVTASNEVSVLLDCGDQAGADFAPVHYAVLQVNVASPVGGSYYHGASLLINANVTRSGQPITDANVTGYAVKSAGGAYLEFNLNDRGIQGDLVPGDGFYASRITLPGPTEMPPGNYLVFVTAQSVQDGQPVSGSGSSIFSISGLASGSLTATPSLSCPNDPDLYAGDTCLLSVVVGYPDGSTHSDGQVTLNVFEPGNQERRIALNYAGANRWQTNYRFAQGGRYLLDVRAYPPGASPYVAGYASLVRDVLASAAALQVTLPSLPATFQLNQIATFTATVSLNGQPVSGATVSAVVNPGQVTVDLTSVGQGRYVGLYQTGSPGNFTFQARATHPLYKPGTQASSFTVAATASNLLSTVQSLARSTELQLNQIDGYAERIAHDGDWFWQRIEQDRFLRNFNFIVNVIGLGLDIDALAGELAQAAARSSGPVVSRFAGINLFSWMRDQADQSIDGRVYRSWATRLETSVRTGLFDQYILGGDLPTNVGKGVLRRAGVYYASEFLGQTMDEVAVTAFRDYLANMRLTHSDFLEHYLYPTLTASVDESKLLVNDYAQAILINPPQPPPTLEQRLVTDLGNRRMANRYFVDDIYHRNFNLWTAQDAREDEENAPWYQGWALNLWKIATPILIGVACGGPVGAGVGVVIGIEQLVEDWIHDTNNLNMDENMHGLAYGSMHSALENTETIRDNSLAGLAQVRSGRSPQTPKGEILAIDDISRGDPILFWFSERQAVSSITIRNNGNYIASYNIRAYYDRLSRWQTRYELFWLDTITDPGLGESMGWVELQPGQTKTVEVVFKDKDQNNLDMRPNNRDDIGFLLAAATLDGVFYADFESHTFVPREETMAGEPLSDELTLTAISHPIATQLGEDRYGTEYTVYYNLENPFPYPISARVTQVLPQYLTVLAPNGGLVGNSQIEWRQVVQPHDIVQLSFVVRNDSPNVSAIELPGAALSLFVPEAATYAVFDSGPLTIPAPDLSKVFVPLVVKTISSSAYQWIDATNGGTVVAVGDDTSQYVALPFSFRFYGNSYSGVYVSSNGFISFGAGYFNYSNSCIPTTGTPNNAIYAFWDDLVPNGGTNGNVYVKQVNASTFVIEWHQVKRYASNDYETFEIVLTADNRIKLQYQSMSNTSSATVGIENATGSVAQQHLCNGAGSPVTNRMAINYMTP